MNSIYLLAICLFLLMKVLSGGSSFSFDGVSGLSKSIKAAFSI
jgi:hypothetical protein